MAKGDVVTQWKVMPHYLSRCIFIEGEKPENCIPKGNRNNGELSMKAIRRIKCYVNWLIYLARTKRVYMKDTKKHFRFRVNFITLTLSSKQEHSDREIKSKMLRPFLRILVDRWGVVNYLWKAETQGNGNIHFHITADQFIHHREIRDTWNTIQETLGYVTRSGIKDPNSTDVHSVKQVRNLASYISKYIAKNDPTRRKIDGKIWDCNSELKAISVKVRDSKIELDELQCLEEGCNVYREFTTRVYFFNEKVFEKLYFSQLETFKILERIYTPEQLDRLRQAAY